MNILLHFENPDDGEKVLSAIRALMGGKPVHSGLLESRLARAIAYGPLPEPAPPAPPQAQATQEIPYHTPNAYEIPAHAPSVEECTCAERSWYGAFHDSACPLDGQPNPENLYDNPAALTAPSYCVECLKADRPLRRWEGAMICESCCRVKFPGEWENLS